ncbi:MAG: arsenate reductase family protein [Cetobacterium sp.]|uniref:arsenate reductase family protein n=1 Tax=Cetobacterium sp. TaxID=2071632 RepID=UPI003F37A40F
MKYLFLNYPKCSTCIKAKKWLDENKIQFESRHIVENNPNKEELKKWLDLSGLPIKKLFNSSGLLYREMNLKEKITKSSENELLEILSSNGMLIKRPLLIGIEKVFVGFKEEEWETVKNK